MCVYSILSICVKIYFDKQFDWNYFVSNLKQLKFLFFLIDRPVARAPPEFRRPEQLW